MKKMKKFKLYLRYLRSYSSLENYNCWYSCTIIQCMVKFGL